MQILIFVAALISGALMGIYFRLNKSLDYFLSGVYIVIASLLILNAAMVNFANIQKAGIMTALVFVLNWGKSISYLLIGYLMTHILKGSNARINSTADYPLHKITERTLWAIIIINGFSFIIETGYKLKNLDDLVDQFAHYGYTKWFLFVIMIAETLGGIGILLHFKLKTGTIAALGLMIIMLGVVFTDWHCNNPFSYSYPAVDAFISLFLMMMILKFEKSEKYNNNSIGFI
jgi:uncharacterized membrane protein YphA (DoxX/SURF4 family)